MTVLINESVTIKTLINDEAINEEFLDLVLEHLLELDLELFNMLMIVT